ncbi:uncharacterized protein METZ01_LOCUS513304, partial [marine metagenome]
MLKSSHLLQSTSLTFLCAVLTRQILDIATPVYSPKATPNATTLHNKNQRSNRPNSPNPGNI